MAAPMVLASLLQTVPVDVIATVLGSALAVLTLARIVGQIFTLDVRAKVYWAERRVEQARLEVETARLKAKTADFLLTDEDVSAAGYRQAAEFLTALEARRLYDDDSPEGRAALKALAEAAAEAVDRRGRSDGS